VKLVCGCVARVALYESKKSWVLINKRWNGENDRHYPVHRSANAFLNVPNEGRRLEANVKGMKFGRKRTIDMAKMRVLRKNGIGATDIAKQMGIGRSTVNGQIAE
jgi:hypothetical protein